MPKIKATGRRKARLQTDIAADFISIVHIQMASVNTF